ncbi:MAG: hypothetical protein IJ017_04885 [Oscillospiraceae bacterium]|nr:hypothetical protein [Oscillospiraceae bacterium]
MKVFVIFIAVLLLITGCAPKTLADPPPASDITDDTAISEPADGTGEDDSAVLNEPPVTEDIAPEADVSDNTTADNTPHEDTPLTSDEIAWFNEQFFNAGDHMFPNLFLLSLYDSPEDINLSEIFYNCIAQLTDEEAAQLAALDFFLEIDEAKVTTEYINEILLQYTGLTLEETNKVGLEYWTYLPDYDAYYHAHGDTNLGVFTIISGLCASDGTVRLRYDDKEVTLIPSGDSYHFVSNVTVAP